MAMGVSRTWLDSGAQPERFHITSTTVPERCDKPEVAMRLVSGSQESGPEHVPTVEIATKEALGSTPVELRFAAAAEAEADTAMLGDVRQYDNTIQYILRLQ
ncbi:uncharacterized protein G6M90_00g033410 [Metarhizium brunneum]|uniref:Uncharacterized protein n=1 Tax=Metarhizium brunneum TaxID=500148 RepID=A0A7D5Z2R3_9HYPO|nr:hypothetical protein G6M90_00g033410 [Metarhizium brunneum]